MKPSTQVPSSANRNRKHDASKSPTICVAVIVKNEEDQIARLLEASRGVCSCWCVLDTGSTDNTLQVLAEYNAKNQATYPGHVFEGPFVDFSQARNLLLDHAQPLADWLLIADADFEWENLEALPGELNDDADCLYLQSSGELQYWGLKCVRTGLPWKYKNRVHEILDPLDSDKAAYSKVLIHHRGEGRATKEKYEWYASLQLQDVEEFPDNPYYPYRLGDTYMNLGRYKEAAKYYRKALRLYEENTEYYYNILFLLGTCMDELGYVAEAQRMWLRASQMLRHRREALEQLMISLNKERNYTRVSELGREASQYPDENEIQKQGKLPLDTLFVDTAASLGVLLEWAEAEAKLGNLHQARTLYYRIKNGEIPDRHIRKFAYLSAFIQSTSNH